MKWDVIIVIKNDFIEIVVCKMKVYYICYFFVIDEDLYVVGIVIDRDIK